MPRKNTPTKKSPGRKSNKSPAASPLTNEKGEITRWDSKGRDGRELAVYVENGCCDAMTAKYVREKFPQFQKYQYACFNAALGGVRRRFNGAVRNRAYDGEFILLEIKRSTE